MKLIINICTVEIVKISIQFTIYDEVSYYEFPRKSVRIAQTQLYNTFSRHTLLSKL